MNPERTTIFLMANVGSELTRFFAFKRQNKMDLAKASADRALKIIQTIIERGRGSAEEEATILKQIIEDAQTEMPRYEITEQELNEYFTPFALRTMAEASLRA